MRLPSDLSRGSVLIGTLGLVLVAMAAIAVGYFTRSHTQVILKAEMPATSIEIVRGVVQAVGPDSITLLTDAGVVTLKVGLSTPREAVQRTDIAGVKVGDWVNAGGVPHAQTLYALTAIVVIPASNLEPGR